MDLDIAFILSGSRSFGFEQFKLLRVFVVSLLNSLPRTGTHVGVVLFSETATSYFSPNWKQDLDTVARRLKTYHYSDSKANTAAGLDYARTELFNSDRSGVPDIAIVVTDGKSNLDTEMTIPSARALHNSGVRIISVGVGTSINETEIKAISSPPQQKGRDYFTSPDLQGVLDSLNSRFGITLIPVTMSTTEPATFFPPRSTTTQGEILFHTHFFIIIHYFHSYHNTLIGITGLHGDLLSIRLTVAVLIYQKVIKYIYKYIYIIVHIDI